MSKYYHSIEVETDKCTGCMQCMRACPTEAMRIREGKALILEDRCIDCGDCIRVCPARAVRSMTGSFEDLTRFKYTIAIPSPPLYSQYGIGITPNHILNGLKGLGFNEVYDIGKACEAYSAVLKEHLHNYSDSKPYISTTCLAVVRLIQINFPELVGNLLSMEAPSAIAGAYKTARAKILGISPQDIGTIFITPCPAKMIAVNHPIFKMDPTLDGAIAISDIYGVLFTAIRKIKSLEPLHNSGGVGVGTGIPGACIASLEIENAIAVDGVVNVIKILEDVERGKINNVNYLELWACPGGCIGGPLAVDNPYLARIKAMKLMRQMGTQLNITPAEVERMRAHLSCDVELSTHPIQPLGMDAADSIKKINERESLLKNLPRINCGACGAPTCKAFAEDVIQGRAELVDCVFKLKEATMESIRRGLDMAQKTPLAIRRRGA
jgi:Na+-translocating ferredoxin:NAD+ oxidoreductase RNF subunit RnfB